MPVRRAVEGALEQRAIPSVHSVFSSFYSDNVVEHGRQHDHPEEYRHGDHLAVWIDTTQKFSLVHEHPEYTSGSRGPHTRGHLTDYTKMLRWSWDYDDKQHKVYNCYLEKTTEEQKAPCISTGADKRGSFTIGETFAVDAYVATYKSSTTESEHETIVQSGSTSKVVEQVSRGKVRRNDTESFFMDRMSFYDLNEAPIDAKVFAVPSECPTR